MHIWYLSDPYSDSLENQALLFPLERDRADFCFWKTVWNIHKLYYGIYVGGHDHIHVEKSACHKKAAIEV